MGRDAAVHGEKTGLKTRSVESALRVRVLLRVRGAGPRHSHLLRRLRAVLLAYVVPLAIYVVQRNAKVQDEDSVFTPRTFKKWFSELGKRKKEDRRAASEPATSTSAGRFPRTKRRQECRPRQPDRRSPVAGLRADEKLIGRRHQHSGGEDSARLHGRRRGREVHDRRDVARRRPQGAREGPAQPRVGRRDAGGAQEALQSQSRRAPLAQEGKLQVTYQGAKNNTTVRRRVRPPANGC